MLKVPKTPRLPAPHVTRNIVNVNRITTSKIRPGMFLRVKYLREGAADERKIIITRVVFVLKRLWERKMHLLDVSRFKRLEFKRFYASYLAENDPERFAALLARDLPTVVEDVKRPKAFYHGTLKIPLKKEVLENSYRTFILNNVRVIDQVYYRTGNTHPLVTDIEVQQILLENGINSYGDIIFGKESYTK